METMSSESEQRLHGEHELQMSKTEKSEQNDREIAAFLTNTAIYGCGRGI